MRDKAPGSIDMLVYRENTEGEYAPIGGRLYPGTPDDIAIQTNVFTRKGCTRIMRAAFEAAAKRPRKKLTSITKSNAQTFGMTLWDECYHAVRAEFPEVSSSSLLVDAAAMDFVRRPESFDVVVASNLFGDILTDLSAQVTGSVGLASSANINPERTFPSMFEPVHGSAPDIAGKGIANPMAAVLSGVLLLRHLGLSFLLGLAEQFGTSLSHETRQFNFNTLRQYPLFIFFIDNRNTNAKSCLNLFAILHPYVLINMGSHRRLHHLGYLWVHT